MEQHLRQAYEQLLDDIEQEREEAREEIREYLRPFYEVFSQRGGQLDVQKRYRELDGVRLPTHFVGEYNNHRIYFRPEKFPIEFFNMPCMKGYIVEIPSSSSPIGKEMEPHLEDLVALEEVGEEFRQHFKYTPFHYHDDPIVSLERAMDITRIPYEEREREYGMDLVVAVVVDVDNDISDMNPPVPDTTQWN